MITSDPLIEWNQYELIIGSVSASTETEKAQWTISLAPPICNSRGQQTRKNVRVLGWSKFSKLRAPTLRSPSLSQVTKQTPSNL
jgi:hypothetical protein